MERVGVSPQRRLSMNTFKFWMVFTVGVASGAVVALICAPQTGAKTRKQLKRTLNDTGDYLKDQFDDAGDYIKDQAAVIGDQATKVYKRGKETASDLSDDVVSNLQSAVKSVKNSIA
jgi:gas vesicle protein